MRHICDKGITHQTESLVRLINIILTSLPLYLRTKHGVMNLGHQWSRIWQWVWQGYVIVCKLPRGIFQVYLIEDAMLIVLREKRPVYRAVATTLSHKPLQVGGSAYLLGTHLPAFFPQHLAALLLRFIQHPAQYQPDITDIFNDREDACLLYIIVTFNLAYVNGATACPINKHLSKKSRCPIHQLSTESVMIAIGTYCPCALTNRNNINTLTWQKLYLPVILRHSCYNMLMTQLPTFTHT